MEFNATFIAALISFVIFIVIMNNILYKPIGDIIQKRKDFIDENYNIAKNNNEKKEALLQDRLDKIKDAKNEAMNKTALARQEALNKKLEAIAQTKKQAAEKIDKEVSNYKEESKKANDELKIQIRDLAQIISDKFVQADERIEEVNSELIDSIMQG